MIIGVEKGCQKELSVSYYYSYKKLFPLAEHKSTKAEQ